MGTVKKSWDDGDAQLFFISRAVGKVRRFSLLNKYAPYDKDASLFRCGEKKRKKYTERPRPEGVVCADIKATTAKVSARRNSIRL